jgi:hypothetical protein
MEAKAKSPESIRKEKRTRVSHPAATITSYRKVTQRVHRTVHMSDGSCAQVRKPSTTACSHTPRGVPRVLFPTSWAPLRRVPSRRWTPYRPKWCRTEPQPQSHGTTEPQPAPRRHPGGTSDRPRKATEPKRPATRQRRARMGDGGCNRDCGFGCAFDPGFD